MSKIYYTSDLHLFHYNIIKYCNRPFNNVDEMHDRIVKEINNTIKPNDVLYILGDVSFYGGEKVRKILHSMNGQKHLILGNHDAKNLKSWDGWRSVSQYKEIMDNKRLVILCHYPIYSWKGKSHGSIHLHGHTHNTLDHKAVYGEKALIADVGVDTWNYKPVTLNDILNEIKINRKDS